MTGIVGRKKGKRRITRHLSSLLAYQPIVLDINIIILDEEGTYITNPTNSLSYHSNPNQDLPF